MLKVTLQKNRNMYVASFRLYDEQGIAHQKMISTGIKAIPENKKKAEEKVKEIAEKYESLNFSDKGDITLSAYAESWINRKKNLVEATTFDGYTNMLETHIKPYFKDKKMIDIKPYTLEEYYSAKIESGLSPNTVLKHHSLIRSILQDAMKNNFVKNNAADLADKPKRNKSQHNYYNTEELKQLLIIAKGTRLELPIFFAVLYGLRRSECIGMKWSAIDFNSRTITVCNKITRRKNNDKWIDFESNKLKSDKSQSVFFMNDAVYNYLRSVKAKQDLLIRETKEYIDYICVDEVGNRIKNDYITQAFSKLLKDNNMRHIRFHDLRHSCISLLVKNNFNMRTVQEYARHSDFALTANTYSHVGAELKKAEITSITDSLMFDNM